MAALPKAKLPRTSPPAGGRDLAVARRVLGIEAGALAALAAGLDGNVAKAVRLLGGAAGRVIVSGMGKSGHVARKIAATFASTGTPAQFVHPAEASHGDLGMITARDCVLMLSNSGETRELADMIHHTKRYRIPLVGVASRRQSALLTAADVALVLPAVEEACPIKLAPTTSTTMMLALGDALAVALMERRGFGRDDYQAFHPGGSLGRSLLKVRDVMHKGRELPLVKSGARLADAVKLMSAKRFGCVGVVEDGKLAGIITDGDLRRHFADDLSRARVEAVMTRNPRVVGAQALLSEAIGEMNRARITVLFVVENGAPKGLLHMHDCLRAGFS